MILSSEGVGAAGLAASGPEGAGLGEERLRVVFGAEELAGASAGEAGSSGVEGGAEA
jgi:hypothetical protein